MKSTMKNILVQKENNFATVTLNKPDMRNAFNPEMIQELKSTFTDLAKDGKMRAVILKGEGKSFCSGADLNWMKDMVRFSFEQNQKDATEMFEMFEAIANCPAPVIGVAHGHVMGGALGLLACCDIVLAEEQTQFCFSEVKIGLAPAVISAFVLKKMNLSSVREMMLSGKVFDTARAHKIGLIHFVGDKAQVDEYLQNTISQFNDCGIEAVRTTKMLLNKVPHLTWDEQKDLTTEAISDRRLSPEGQEGLKAFLEKRTPTWRSNNG